MLKLKGQDLLSQRIFAFAGLVATLANAGIAISLAVLLAMCIALFLGSIA